MLGQFLKVIVRADSDGFREILGSNHSIELFFNSVKWSSEPVRKPDCKEKYRSANNGQSNQNDTIDAMERGN